MKCHLKSRNSALATPRHHEAVAFDTIFSYTPAVDSGVKQAQVFVSRDTLVADAYPMKSGGNLSTPLRITLYDKEPWTNSSVIQPKLRSPIGSWTSFGLMTFPIGILSHTTKIRILLNGSTGLSKPGPIQS